MLSILVQHESGLYEKVDWDYLGQRRGVEETFFIANTYGSNDTKDWELICKFSGPIFSEKTDLSLKLWSYLKTEVEIHIAAEKLRLIIEKAYTAKDFFVELLNPTRYEFTRDEDRAAACAERYMTAIKVEPSYNFKVKWLTAHNLAQSREIHFVYC